MQPEFDSLNNLYHNIAAQDVLIRFGFVGEYLVRPAPQPMPSISDPAAIQLEELCALCASETERFFRHREHTSLYCFELFRRAIVARDQDAWDFLYSQYQPLVKGWIRRHSLSAVLGEDIEYLVNRVFERMWSGVTPRKFANFPDLKSILRYLQMCVNAVLVDIARRSELASQVDEEFPLANVSGEPERRSMEDMVLRKTQAERLWQLLDERCKNDKERGVLQGMFVNGLKARQLYDAFQDVFDDVQDVYRVKENLIARLQRDQDLIQVLERL